MSEKRIRGVRPESLSFGLSITHVLRIAHWSRMDSLYAGATTQAEI